MVHRQGLHKNIATALQLVTTKQCICLEHVGHKITVRQHGPLGNTGGTPGVLEHCQVIALQMRN